MHQLCITTIVHLIQFGVLLSGNSIMNKTIRIIGVSVAVLAVFAIWCFISYKPDKGIETVLDTMLTSPNEDIFSLSGTINTPLSDSEYETVYLTEKAVWEEAVGKYFAEKRFDSFMKQWERTEFLVKAAQSREPAREGSHEHIRPYRSRH